MLKSATVPPGTPGRVRSILLVVSCLMLDLFVCFKGPPARYLHNSRPRFRAFFWVSFFAVFLEANGHPQGPQNRLKSSKIVFQRPPWEHSEKRDQKWSEKSFFRKAGYAIRTRLCSPNTLFRFHFPVAQGSKKGAKKCPKWSLWASQITKKPEKWTLKKTLKNWCKKYQKRTSKRTTFSWRRGLQNHKNPSLGS